MKTPSDEEEHFSGLRVVAFESRRAEDISKLIRRLGGEPLVAPAMREVALDDQQEAFRFAKRLFAGTIDVLILLTGVGTRALVEALSTKYPTSDIVHAFSKIPLVVRGPKPIVALTELGLKPTITVPEPNTWRDILATLDTQWPVKGKRVAVQEYGTSNQALLEGLAARGAEIVRVPVYRWALPEDVGPLRNAVQAICDQRADVLLFTAAIQIQHVLQIAKAMGVEAVFQSAVQRCVIASVGPICTDALTRHGFQVDIEPAHPKMGSLLSEAGRQSRSLLQRKRGPVH